MLLNRPFVETLKVFNKYYLYDVNNNQVTEISSELYNIFNQTWSEINVEDKNIIREIKTLFYKGFLHSNPIKSINHHALDYINSYLYHCSSITLQTTQACNFKCRYCSYASETNLNRHHKDNYMNIETAKASIDFLYAHSQDENNIDICFYGGEPLLNYKMIEYTVKYAESIFCGKNIKYLITTNGSIINDNILELFNKYKFIITVSLDGPNFIHNKNRRWRINGKGTYEEVIKNILNLKTNIIDYKNKIQINAVIDPEENLDDYYNFFENEFPIKDIPIKYSIIDASKLRYNIYPDDRFKYNEKHITLLKYLRILASDTSIDLLNLKNQIFNIYNMFQPTKYLSEIENPGGTCIPGYIKMFVMQNGDILPCEKVSENSFCMKIGSIYTGFEIDKIKDFISIGKTTSKLCKNCIAIRHCNICPREIDDIEKFDVDYKNYQCRFSVKNFYDSLVKYILYQRCGIFDKVLNSFGELK